MTTVVNKHYEQYDVYIGRGSLFGNPFPITDTVDRARAIAAYRIWLWKQIKAGRITKEQLLALDGKRLGCFCAPKACHGDVLIKAIQWAKENR